MTEREKMLAGENFDSRDPELLEMYHKARRLLKEINHLDSESLDERGRLFDELFSFKGEGVWIENPFFCEYGVNISIGSGTFLNVNVCLLDNNKITIGENTLIGPGVQVYTSSHPLAASDRIKKEEDRTFYLTSAQAVTIGDNVWIGGNSVIFPGVTIGSNSTIGAGSVVTKNIPDGVLAFGNPCKVVRKL